MGEKHSREIISFLSLHEWEDDSSGLACNGNARKIVEAAARELGVKGSIWEVFQAHGRGGEFDLSHSYVVLEIQHATEMALNQQRGTRARTVQEVMSRGTDITEEILHLPWDQLK